MNINIVEEPLLQGSVAMWLLLLLVTLCAFSVSCIELTFELPDKEVQCFFEDIKVNVKTVLEFQVYLFEQDFGLIFGVTLNYCCSALLM